MQHSFVRSGVLFLIANGACTCFAAQPAFRLSDLGNLGATGGQALAVNSWGQVAGFARTNPSDPNGRHAFLWTSGTMQDLGSFAGAESFGYGLNDLGDVVGYSGSTAFLWTGSLVALPSLGGQSIALGVNNSRAVVGQSNSKPVRWVGMTVEELPTLSGTSGYATDVNDDGVVIGGSSDIRGVVRATKWTSSGPEDLGSLGIGRTSNAQTINTNGQIVGYSQTDLAGAPTRATLWTNGSVRELENTIGASQTYALGINDLGQVVGEFSGGPNNGGAFLWQDGVMYDLSTLLDSSGTGWTLVQARAINNSGQIAGFASFDGEVRAVLFSPVIPVPEPTAIAALVCGSVFLCRTRKGVN